MPVFINIHGFDLKIIDSIISRLKGFNFTFYFNYRTLDTNDTKIFFFIQMQKFIIATQANLILQGQYLEKHKSVDGDNNM